MSDVIFLVLKVIIISLFAMYVGKKAGLFSLGRLTTAIVLIVLAFVSSAEIYASFFRDDITLKIIFSSSFLSFTLDLSFFLRVFLLTLLAGLICSCFGVKLSSGVLSAKDICVLALLIALSVLLAVYGTIRIGAGIKISLKFIAVFITAALYGPLWGGAVAALSDVIAFIINPVGGMFLPQITIVEFLYGFTYGLVFFNMGSWHGFKTMLKIVLCVIFQIGLLNLCLTSYFLMPLMKMEFKALVVMRSVSALINMASQLVVLAFISKYISSFRKILK